MKKFILLLSIIALFCQSAFAQTGGLNFQGVARNATGAVLANQKINLKFSILKTTETGTVEYTETKEATTNAQGIFAVVVGEVNATSFAAVDWKDTPKFLKVEMDAAGGTSFITMGTTRLQNVPFAYYANGVNANNIDGAISVAKGGTGATDAATARANLGLNIGTNVQAPLTAGTDYLTPTGSAASLTNFPTLNQNTTGNAASATIAGNITATSNTTLTTLSNLTTVGTITSGVWSGTLIPIAKGGTGSSTQNFVDLTSAQTVAGAKSFTGSMVVGAATGTGSSAALEVKSTTQGFLPPRLTKEQRDAISSPEIGLVVFCTNCGAYGELEVYDGSLSWKNLLGGSAASAAKLFHYAYNGSNTSMYSFDGASWSTVNTNLPTNFSTYFYIGQLGSKSYFNVNLNGTYTLYSFDGTTFVSTGITAPTNINSYSYLGSINNKIYYNIYNGSSYTLYSFDGTNFTSLPNISAPANLSSSAYLGVINNKIYYNVYNSGNGTYGMYYFDGTAFTSMVLTAPSGTNLYRFIGTIANKSYFNVYNGVNGTYTMYSFDGVAFTALTAAPLSGISLSSYLGTIGPKSYFNVYNGVNGTRNFYTFDGLTWTLLTTPNNMPTYAGGWIDYMMGGSLILY